MSFRCQQTDLPPELLDFAHLSVQEGAKLCATRSDLCRFVRDSLERRAGGVWHVVAGHCSVSIRYRRGTCAIFERKAPTEMRVVVFQSSGQPVELSPSDAAPDAAAETRALDSLDTNWAPDGLPALRAAMERAFTLEDDVAVAKAVRFALHSLSQHDGWHVLAGRRGDFDWAVRWPADEAGTFVNAVSGPLRAFAFRHKPEDAVQPFAEAGVDPVTLLAVQVLQACLYGIALLLGGGALHIRMACSPEMPAAEAAASVQELLPPAKLVVGWMAERAVGEGPVPTPTPTPTPDTLPPWVAARTGEEGSLSAASLVEATPAACASSAFAMGVACAAVLLLSGGVRLLVRRQQQAAARAAAVRMRQRQREAESASAGKGKGKGSRRRK